MRCVIASLPTVAPCSPRPWPPPASAPRRAPTPRRSACARCGAVSGPVVSGRVVVRLAPHAVARTLARVGGDRRRQRGAGGTPLPATRSLTLAPRRGRSAARSAGSPATRACSPPSPSAPSTRSPRRRRTTRTSALWGMTQIGAPAAWTQTTGSPSVIVGIVDTGIDASVADLAPNIWTNPGETGTDALGRNKASNGVDDDGDGAVDDVHGWNALNGTGDVVDDYGHGTHVAGTIGAARRRRRRRRRRDVERDAPARQGARRRRLGLRLGVAQGLAYAARHGARVVSASLGGHRLVAGRWPTPSHAYPNTLFVFAAGNSARERRHVAVLPVHRPRRATRSASAATDTSDALASFSNYGATERRPRRAGRQHAELVARLAAYASGHVDGDAARLRRRGASCSRGGPPATVAQVKAALLAGVDPRRRPRRPRRDRRPPRRRARDDAADDARRPAAGRVGARRQRRHGYGRDRRRLPSTAPASARPGGSRSAARRPYGTHVDGGVGRRRRRPARSRPALGGLAPSTVYHVRLVAQAAAGTTASADATFTTRPAAPP